MSFENSTNPARSCDTSRADTAAIRVQLISDLHLELLTSRASPHWHGVTQNPQADLLVLAGDIGRCDDVVRHFGSWPTPVVFVLGNHEFYNSEMKAMRRHVREATEGTSIILLDNEEIGSAELAKFTGWFEPRQEKLAKLRVLGATLWTDYNYPTDAGPDDWRTFRMSAAQRQLNDHRLIAYEDTVFRPAHALAEHQATVTWLNEALAVPFDGRTVVVTHHAPSGGSVHPRYRGNPLNAAFVCNLPAEMMSRVDLWLHGHVHDSFDYKAHGCRVVANPRGYLRKVDAVDGSQTLAFENANFDASLLVTI